MMPNDLIMNEAFLLKHLSRLTVALETIAETLQALVPPKVDPSLPVVCQHPVEARVDFGAQGMEEWLCDPARGGCGYHYKRVW